MRDSCIRDHVHIFIYVYNAQINSHIDHYALCLCLYTAHTVTCPCLYCHQKRQHIHIYMCVCCVYTNHCASMRCFVFGLLYTQYMCVCRRMSKAICHKNSQCPHGNCLVQQQQSNSKQIIEYKNSPIYKEIYIIIIHIPDILTGRRRIILGIPLCIALNNFFVCVYSESE